MPRRLVILSVLILLSLGASGCRRRSCVPVAEQATGEPRREYDEFTRVLWLTSWFVLTPDEERRRMSIARDEPAEWSVELWLRGASNAPFVDMSLRALCSKRQLDDEQERCVNCDDVCSANTGFLEVLADGQPIIIPKGRYDRVPIGAPAAGGPSTWASTISLRLSPRVLAPLERARVIKLRMCNAITVTLRPSEVAYLQEYLRHHHAIAPPEPLTTMAPVSLPEAPIWPAPRLCEAD
ncbi:MAG: hypothetical protein KC731_03020 [Myxococcales bacterium]|nr:hypothetical protein [Myxococcales bacterium]